MSKSRSGGSQEHGQSSDVRVCRVRGFGKTGLASLFKCPLYKTGGVGRGLEKQKCSSGVTNKTEPRGLRKVLLIQGCQAWPAG